MFPGIINFASTEAGEKSDLLGSLGINVQLLVLQTIAFLILLFILSKFVFPVLTSMLEKREKLIEDSVRVAQDAEKNAEKTQDEVAKLIKEARKEADAVISGAKSEASKIVDNADKKSRERAERIVADAEEEINKNITDAKNSLRQETLELVAEATGMVIGKTIDAKIDKQIIKSAISESEK